MAPTWHRGGWGQDTDAARYAAYVQSGVGVGVAAAVFWASRW